MGRDCSIVVIEDFNLPKSTLGSWSGAVWLNEVLWYRKLRFLEISQTDANERDVLTHYYFEG